MAKAKRTKSRHPRRRKKLSGFNFGMKAQSVETPLFVAAGAILADMAMNYIDIHFPEYSKYNAPGMAVAGSLGFMFLPASARNFALGVIGASAPEAVAPFTDGLISGSLGARYQKKSSAIVRNVMDKRRRMVV